MIYYHAFKINETMFWVCSEAADYEYIVELEKVEQLETAMEIAEREASMWGGGYHEELAVDDENYSYYENAGYVEVLENALREAGIEAKYFVNMHEEK